MPVDEGTSSVGWFWQTSEHGVGSEIAKQPQRFATSCRKGFGGAGLWSQALVITTGPADRLALIEIGEAISGSVSILARVSVRAVRPAGLITFVSLSVGGCCHGSEGNR